ncbi:SRPBCC domain-containing protein [Dinghuibacter silviterrae]|uniref:Uncharacterized protein YndB with AHSA1/START domain n=1 Tax=Dinghuibacter silviterrae TaxID=1539049 RepID=A0A4R8DFS3_9BACT|nr:SRPBCC domain-containing protein [Dinghuibacter silviterrae]TDW95946.1 uncharacterized protein YndB with AHSA1/START domain [Dinghuibacter silviterrae]
MEQKTKIVAEDGKQEMVITREFDLPVALLFRAHAEAELVEQWMGTQVIKLESEKHGSYQYLKTDDKGNVLFKADGVIHEFIPNHKIIRTFEMANVPLGVQLEIYAFERLTDDTSKLHMHVIYESVTQRDQVVQMGMTQGINWAHDRIQAIAGNLKK